MSTNKDITLYLDNKNPPPVVNVSQGDTDWLYRFTVMYNNAVYSPSVTYVILTGHKPDGHVFAYRGAKSGNLYTVTPANANGNLVQMTAVAGDVPCELRLISGGRSVGTANFILRVEPGPEGVVTVASASALPAYTTILQELGVLIGKVETLPDDVPGWIGDWLEAHISGGQGVAVDNTLSIQGAAADAKATGDRIRALEDKTIETDDTLTVSGAAADAEAVGAILGTTGFSLSSKALWEQGGISYGEKVDNNARIRLKNPLPAGVTSVTATGGYQLILHAYQNGNYIGFWNGSAYATSGSGDWHTGSYTIPEDGYGHILSLRNGTGSDAVSPAAAAFVSSNLDGEGEADGLIQQTKALRDDVDVMLKQMGDNGSCLLSDEAKNAILACFRSVYWKDNNVDPTPYQTLQNVFFPPTHVLPEGFKQLKYLESSGQQYIKTGVIPANNMGYRITMSVRDVTSDHFIFGTRENSGDTRYVVGITSGRFYVGWGTILGGGSHNSNPAIFSDETVTIETNFMNSRLILINNADCTLDPPLPALHACTKELVLFGRNLQAGISGAQQRLDEMFITNGNFVTKHYIPVERELDGEAGVYELIEGEFLTNDGSGEFLKGGYV